MRGDAIGSRDQPGTCSDRLRRSEHGGTEDPVFRVLRADRRRESSQYDTSEPDSRSNTARCDPARQGPEPSHGSRYSSGRGFW